MRYGNERKYWNHDDNKPEKQLVVFLEEKVQSVKRRIKEATGVDIEPIYYSAGYKEGRREAKSLQFIKTVVFHSSTYTKGEAACVYKQYFRNPETGRAMMV